MMKQITRMFTVLMVFLFALTSQMAAALNDPMKPPFFDGSSTAQAKEVVRPLRLSMVLMSDSHRVAILNGQSVGVGESVDGHRVLRIDRNKVVVSRKGKVKEIHLGGATQRDKTQVSNTQMVVEN
jgi:hypothetical protein